MGKFNWIKIAGIAATGLGFIATIIGNWASDKEMRNTVREVVKEEMSSNDAS